MKTSVQSLISLFMSFATYVLPLTPKTACGWPLSTLNLKDKAKGKFQNSSMMKWLKVDRVINP